MLPPDRAPRHVGSLVVHFMLLRQTLCMPRHHSLQPRQSWMPPAMFQSRTIYTILLCLAQLHWLMDCNTATPICPRQTFQLYLGAHSLLYEYFKQLLKNPSVRRLCTWVSDGRHRLLPYCHTVHRSKRGVLYQTYLVIKF